MALRAKKLPAGNKMTNQKRWWIYKMWPHKSIHPRMSSSVNGIFSFVCFIFVWMCFDRRFFRGFLIVWRNYCVIGKRALCGTIRACDTSSELNRLYQQQEQKHMIKDYGCIFSHLRSHLHQGGIHSPGAHCIFMDFMRHTTCYQFMRCLNFLVLMKLIIFCLLFPVRNRSNADLPAQENYTAIPAAL